MTQTSGIARTYAAATGCEMRPQRKHLEAAADQLARVLAITDEDRHAR